MKRGLQFALVLIVTGIVVIPPYAQAEALTSFDQGFDFQAIGAADQVQNNLDDTETSNADTWDPVPQGVWFGGWPVESLLRLDDVPDTDFQVTLATVCRFSSNLIMSGASRTLVRLPIHTSDDPWTSATLTVYKISADSNWTFSRFDKTAQNPGYDLGHMRINFTAGTHEQVFWSQLYDPTDESPTDGDDHFSRSNRTYAFVDAPIHPGQFYLFVTNVQYAADKYVDVYIQPDSLDSDGGWNRSTIATYNEEAPDTYSLESDDFNASCGYSFDFRNGFGNSGTGLNIWVDAGDELEFFSYLNISRVVGTDYLTFMLPYRSTVDNISFDIALQEFNPSDGTITEFAAYSDYICRDFILFSLVDDWDTCSTAHSLDLTGWFRISLTINNDTRLWLPLWDIPAPTGEGAQFNSSWRGTYIEMIWDSNDPYSYNFMQLIEHEKSGSQYYTYHWMVQHTFQFNNYRWDRTSPPTTGTELPDPTDDMSLLEKWIFGLGSATIKIGNFVMEFEFIGGTALRAIGTSMQLMAQYGNMPDFAGYVWDKLQPIRDFFAGVGQWLWRAAQAIIGFIQIFIDLASFVLGIIILILAIAAAFIPIMFSFYVAMAFRKAILGDLEGAKAEMTGVVKMVSTVSGKGG